MTHAMYESRTRGGGWIRETAQIAQLPENFKYTHLLNVASRDMNVNGSVTPVIFKYTVPADKAFLLTRLNLVIEDNSVDPSNFGGIAELTTGVEIVVHNTAHDVLADFTDGFPIKTNKEFGIMAGTDSVIQTGVGDDALLVRFSMNKAGAIMILEAGDHVEMTINDDLSSVSKFYGMVQGLLLDAI